MRVRHVARLVGAAVVAAGAVLCSTSALEASAAACPDVEVVFARGSTEAPGVGLVGQSLVDALRAQLGPRSVDVYPVNYPASGDFASSGFASQVLAGVHDAGAHVRATAGRCPATKIVLGGYSQGAIVAAFVAAAEPASGVPAPVVADHVAAVTLFGKPSGAFVGKYDAPNLDLGPQYVAQTIDLCIPGDTVCDGNPGGGTNAAHRLYASNGMTSQAAQFAAERIPPAPAPAA
jgi:cutinase